MIKKPMLAVECTDIYAIKYPVLVSPKLDGIRCIIQNGEALTRSFKAIPNIVLANKLATVSVLLGIGKSFDGELCLRDDDRRYADFNETSSVVMSHDKDCRAVSLSLFDVYDSTYPYRQRFGMLKELERSEKFKEINKIMPFEILNHNRVDSVEDLIHLEQYNCNSGFEGSMIRSFKGPYKFGRSTEKEGYLMKLKRFSDGEAEIVGYIERMHNANEKKADAFGTMKPNSKKAGMKPMGTLGALLVVGVGGKFDGIEFEIGTGFSDDLRATIWKNKSYNFGKLVKFKYQDFGVVDKPRLPVFVGFRDLRDL